jgi:hypothetical protein
MRDEGDQKMARSGVFKHQSLDAPGVGEPSRPPQSEIFTVA